MFKRGLRRVQAQVRGEASAPGALTVARNVRRVLRSGLFDREFYEAQVGRAFPTPRAAAADYLGQGLATNLAPNPLTEPEWCTTPRGKRSRDPLALLQRDRTVTSPGPLFHIPTYLARTPSAARHPGGPLGHFLTTAGEDEPLPVPPEYLGTAPTWGAARRALLAVARRNAGYEALRGPRRSASWDRAAEARFVARWSAVEPVRPVPADPDAAVPPVVSVVMPVRNRPVQVLAAIASVRAQTLPSWELLVVDDGSTDATASAVEEVARGDTRIRLVRIPPSGVSAARNVAVEAARGDYLAFLDSDNTWVPHFLQVMLAHLTHEGLRAGYSVVDAGPDVPQRFLAFRGGLDHLLVLNHIDLNAFVVERDLLRSCGGFDEELRRWVDHDVILRVARQVQIPLVPFIGVEYDHADDAADRITRSESDHWQYRVLGKNLVDWPALEAALGDRVPGRVSICISTYQDWQSTLRAVRAVLAAGDAAGGSPPGTEIEIVVLDNGSRRCVSAVLTAACLGEPRIRVLTTPRNLFSAVGFNQAFGASTGSTVVFLSNDVEVSPGWLAPLLAPLADPAVRGAQPLLLGPDGTVDCAGTVFLGGELPPVALLSGHAPEDVHRAGQLRLSAVTGAALAMRATDVVALRGLDPLFVEGFEDVDLCLRAVAEQGGAFAVAPDSVVTRHPGAARPREDGVQANRALWQDRWRGRLPGPELEVFDRLGLRIAHLDPGPAPGAPGQPRRPRPVLVRPPRTVPAGPAAGLPSLRWALKIAAPAGRAGDSHQDMRFAAALAGALERLGQDASVDRREAHERRTAYLDDVVVGLRGAQECPVHPGRVNLLWVLSHPELVSAGEVGRYDAAFAAGTAWSASMSEQAGLEVRPLLPATDPGRFGPGRGDPGPDAPGEGAAVLFVGESSDTSRTLVREVMTAGLDLSVYGAGWEGFGLGERLKGASVTDGELAASYASAGVVLCAPGEGPGRADFPSGQVFDAVACGARVVSGPIPGMEVLFGGAVQEYRSVQELVRLCGPAGMRAFPGGEDRRRIAEQVCRDHSFDVRARTLLDAALQVRECAGWVPSATRD